MKMKDYKRISGIGRHSVTNQKTGNVKIVTYVPQKFLSFLQKSAKKILL